MKMIKRPFLNVPTSKNKSSVNSNKSRAPFFRRGSSKITEVVTMLSG